MHANNGEQFVPMSDYISLSEEMGEEMQDDYEFDNTDYEDYGENVFLPENLLSEDTMIN